MGQQTRGERRPQEENDIDESRNLNQCPGGWWKTRMDGERWVLAMSQRKRNGEMAVEISERRLGMRQEKRGIQDDDS